jgi:hypothetical protein
MKYKSVIRRIYQSSKFLQYLRSQLILLKIKYFPSIYSKILANKEFRNVFKRDINWSNPINLIEKINWLQIYSDTSLWTRCADKYLVREYVKEKGCGDILNKLYGKWDNVNEIDWESLPNSFVLKTNNSCGKVILIKNKKDINKYEVYNKLNEWLNTKYGYHNAQLHYTRIKPCIIAENLFVNKDEPEKSVIDYKIWCFNGIPECILVVFNRTENGYFLSSYDLGWNNISKKIFNANSTHVNGTNVSKPKSLKKMIESAKILSEGIPQVRIDFYDIDGDAVFGEMTFSTGYGYYTDEYYNYLGSKIDLSRITKLNTPNKFVF